jgi:hypothetical protein
MNKINLCGANPQNAKIQKKGETAIKKPISDE